MFDYGIMIAVYVFMFYIGAVTYWVFRKFDRYEKIAIDLITQRMVSRHQIVDVSTDMSTDVSIIKSSMNSPKNSSKNSSNVETEIVRDIIPIVAHLVEKMPLIVQSSVNEGFARLYKKICLELMARMYKY